MEENKVKSNVPEDEVTNLKNWLNKSIEDNRQLTSRLHEVTNILNIMPYLFKILELKEEFSESIKNKAKEAIENIIFPKQESDTKEESK